MATPHKCDPHEFCEICALEYVDDDQPPSALEAADHLASVAQKLTQPGAPIHMGLPEWLALRTAVFDYRAARLYVSENTAELAREIAREQREGRQDDL